jgi:hypothetical protein
MSDYINSIIYCLECSMIRMKYYKETGEPRHLEDSDNYLRVANIYMKEITKNENCESIN